MTHAEWLVSEEPIKMLLFAHKGIKSIRKLHLFACACCRRIWHLLIDERSKNAVLTIERYADMMSSLQEVATAFSESEIAFRACEHITARHADAARAVHALTASCEDWIMETTSTALAAAKAAGYLEDDSSVVSQENVKAEYLRQSSLVRDIYQSLYCRSIVEPSWLVWNDRTVVKIAEGIYSDRAFDRLAILADALEEAGCDDAHILGHLRGPGPHVLGCWPLDLVLGKS